VQYSGPSPLPSVITLARSIPGRSGLYRGTISGSDPWIGKIRVMDQPAIAVGATYTCVCGTPIRRVQRVGDRDGFEVENFRWSGVVLVAVLHECEVQRLPPISGSGGLRRSGEVLSLGPKLGEGQHGTPEVVRVTFAGELTSPDVAHDDSGVVMRSSAPRTTAVVNVFVHHAVRPCMAP